MNQMPTGPLAHVSLTDGEWRFHYVGEHLYGVANQASLFAAHWRAGEWAHLAGLWHDLGKYSPRFQQRIRSKSGFDPEANLDAHVDHAKAGALWALQRFARSGHSLAYVIAGHHTGLADWTATGTPGAMPLSQRFQATHELAECMAGTPDSTILSASAAEPEIPGGREGYALWVRMVFSALVDADFLDTETFMNPAQATMRPQLASIDALKARLDAHLEAFVADSELNRERANILAACRKRAALAPGVFTLSVPTGGGKTLASMAFALEHATAHKKHRRVIVAIPYTSIIEQTADTYRNIFGDAVIEHHSQFDGGDSKESNASRLATENWDARIVVTTTVQLFESLFAVKTSRCRKLHNIAGSVIILDEAQTLPPGMLAPILQVLNLLVDHYGVTLVICTATQPALNERPGKGVGHKPFSGLRNAREIISDDSSEVDRLYQSLTRVRYELPKDFSQPRTWEDLANQIELDWRASQQLLVIVNSRADCVALWEKLRFLSAIHLSAAMCGEHKSAVVKRVKGLLSSKQPVLLVSTQVVEAGVDLDFPVVYRALAGIDSIVQAAGRCNREGRLLDLADQAALGKVVVFVPPKAPSAQVATLRDAYQTAIGTFSGLGEKALAREGFQYYFEQMYRGVDFKRHAVIAALTPGSLSSAEVNFRHAATLFKVIDEAGQVPVIVRYGEAVDELIAILEAKGPERWLMRKLQRYTVSSVDSNTKAWLQAGDVSEVRPGILVQVSSHLYQADTGLGGQIAPANLVL